MTVCVVEVGPEQVRGPGCAPPQQVRAALEYIDDRLALLDGSAVTVDDLWRDVLRAATHGDESRVVIVVPTWWSAGRFDVVGTAARAVFADATVMPRSVVLRGEATVVELSADWIVVTPKSSEPLVLSRGSLGVEAHLAGCSSVIIDAPAGVQPLSIDVVAALRHWRIPFSHSSHAQMSAAVAAMTPEPPRVGRARPGRGTAAVLAGIALTAATAGGSWAAQAFTAPPVGGDATRLLTEGRVEVRVPAAWAAERVTSGAGSERVRVAPPAGMPALHITQSVGEEASLAHVAETLRAAIGSEPGGVFVDFRPAGQRGGRSAVTYVERRGDTETRWAVLVDGATRIAIGCQHPSGHPEHIEDVCAEAVHSARALK
ncbi:type VII secretion-associated protein [Mycolicibacterium sp. BiH015]|uniref:type VII secretion-associated protein n=1 Tax=Mycolicibacterium sp. BiH015 TaxID=3018808 RepID=UPI0022DFF6C4|nr:type VII secretion-associated protein [Mycolicibacterium sp. BiH015]MDA2894997.1 type VII secretion-associated protein [Mycolicibacterium sp. BiH015]